MALKHAKTSGKADGGDATLVQPSDWNAGHVVDVNGISISSRTDNTDVATPAADTLVLYAKNIANRVVPKWIGPSGVDLIIQPHIGTNGIRYLGPGAGTAVGTYPGVATPAFDVFGMGFISALISTGATLAQATLASTTLLTQTRRVQMITGATSAAGVYVKGTSLECWRGNAASLGGFFFVARFAVSTLIATTRVFVGLVDVTAAPTNVDWLNSATTTPGRIGLAININTGNWQLNRTLTSAAPTNVDLGATMPNTASQFMELVLFCKPNDTAIYYRVTNLTTGAVVTGNVATNIPANTTFLTPMAVVCNNTTASTTLDLNKIYLESDY